MPTYVALLRAVNVGKRQVSMAALRGWLDEAGFTEVETHIQTGNVKVRTPMRSPSRVEETLERVIGERAGFEVPCIMLTPRELRQVHEAALGIETPGFAAEDVAQRRYVVFMKQPVSDEAAAALARYEAPRERIVAIGRHVHVWIAGPFSEAKVFGRFAKILAPGTNRDLKVVAALTQRWGD